MIETVLLAFIAAKIKKYRLSPIFRDFAIYPVLLCAIGYVYLERMIWIGDYSLIRYTSYFKSIYLISLIILAIRHNYKALYGIILYWLGWVLNVVAIKANSNKMPVFPDLTLATGYAAPDIFTNTAKYGDFHVQGNAYTHLIPLTDIFDVGYSVMSIGDVLVRAFVFIVIYTSIKSINTK